QRAHLRPEPQRDRRPATLSRALGHPHPHQRRHLLRRHLPHRGRDDGRPCRDGAWRRGARRRRDAGRSRRHHQLHQAPPHRYGRMTRATIVAETSDLAEANVWLDALRDAGLAANLVERGAGAAFGGAHLPFGVSFRLITDEAHLDRARSIIADLGGARKIAPYRDADEAGQRTTSLIWMML